MSIDPENKGLLLGPLADAYDLSDADADRILANVQATFAREASGADSSSRVARTTATSGGWKVLLVGAACVALAVGGASIGYAPTDAPTVATSPVRSPGPSGTTGTRGALEAAPAMPSVSIDELPSVAPANAAPANGNKPSARAAAPSATPQAAADDTLEAETALLESARRALRSGDAAGALARLDEHAQRFPKGWLATDRAGERIIVLCGLGRRAEATREAAVFLEGRPKTPLTRRVESSCAVEPATKAVQ